MYTLNVGHTPVNTLHSQMCMQDCWGNGPMFCRHQGSWEDITLSVHHRLPTRLQTLALLMDVLEGTDH